MKRTTVKSTDIVHRVPKKDLMFHGLNELLNVSKSLLQRVTHQISLVTHSETPDEQALVRECNLCLQEYQRLFEACQKIVGPIEMKVNTFYMRKTFVKQDPFPACSWSPVVLLNLLREQAIGRRQQEIAEFEKRKRDMIQQLEAGLEMCRECFAQLVPQLNLLSYMNDCVKNEHALPANVMYTVDIPKKVRSPFSEKGPNPRPVPRAQIRKAGVTPLQPQPAPQGAVHTMPSEDRAAARARELEELKEKRKALLRKMRDRQHVEAEQEADQEVYQEVDQEVDQEVAAGTTEDQPGM